MKVKKLNIARIIWVVCLFLVLIVILLMVMDYKINYEYLTDNYLYFYECSSNICVMDVKDDDKLMFSYYDCGESICPTYRKVVADDYALLTLDNKNILYQYRTGTVISEDYDSYEFIDSNYIIVSKNSVYGIIDVNNKEIVKPIYDEIGLHENGYLTGYNFNSIIACKNSKYGAISYRDGKMSMEFQYTDEELEDILEMLKKES